MTGIIETTITAAALGLAILYAIDLAHNGRFDLPVIRKEINWREIWARIKGVFHK